MENSVRGAFEKRALWRGRVFREVGPLTVSGGPGRWWCFGGGGGGGPSVLENTVGFFVVFNAVVRKLQALLELGSMSKICLAFV